MIQNPLNSGFHMPAEWEKHTAVWLAWPHDEITFPNGRVKKVEKIYVEYKHLHESEDVELLVLNRK
jgi:agmatine deiminase